MHAARALAVRAVWAARASSDSGELGGSQAAAGSSTVGRRATEGRASAIRAACTPSAAPAAAVLLVLEGAARKSCQLQGGAVHGVGAECLPSYQGMYNIYINIH